jgi:hypothetical protein
MHWSGVIRIVAIVAAVCAWAGVQYGLGTSWYLGIAAALITYLLLPVIIGLVWGHRTLVEVSRYTKAADQVHLAQTAIDRLTAQQSAQRVPTPVKRVGKNPEKPNEINVDLFNWRTGQDETMNSYVIKIAM